ncbi:hypothetical protein HOLleu_00683 [Holothuria leucospilota]|uniref:PiggyBac transposable element-derived protein domain-containing protein n=1 Tax=Holothuria leucospilota TaxID=206669 RepID=A0A9Q1CMK0_HOLLE|nr:hypothetical protein HOLleu_00683 [Holothuria leucospilota]
MHRSAVLLSLIVERRENGGGQKKTSPPLYLNSQKKKDTMQMNLLIATHLRRKAVKWWHRLLWGIIDTAFINALIVYKELHGDHSQSVLEFRRNVSRGLLTMAKPIIPKRGRPSMSPNTSSPTANQGKKRRGVAPSVPGDVRFHNLGVHWPEYGRERGRCELCSLANVQSRPHSRCSTCKVFLCCNERKNCFRAYHTE